MAWKKRDEMALVADLREARERLDAAKENMVGSWIDRKDDKVLEENNAFSVGPSETKQSQVTDGSDDDMMDGGSGGREDGWMGERNRRRAFW